MYGKIKEANVGAKNIYQVLFESAGEGLIVVNDEGTIVMINPRIEEIFGFSHNEIIGEKIEILIPREYHKGHKKNRENYTHEPAKRSMGTGMDLSGVKKDGSKIPVEVSLNHFNSGGANYILALVTDISERKKSEEKIKELNSKLEIRVEQRTKELKDSQRLYSIVARNFPHGTINVFDRDLKYVFVEGKELFAMGITSEKLIGTKYIDRLSSDIAEKIEEELISVFNGESKSLEIEHEKGFYVLNAVPLPNEDGFIPQILVVEENITEQKKAQQDMETALYKEKELNVLKSRFVSMASHEFRTPLSTVLSSVSLIERYIEKGDTEKTEKHISRIKSSIGNLTSILNDFLSIDKLEAGKIECNPSEFELNTFIGEVLDELQAVTKSGQVINFEHDKQDTNVLLDKQILKNIIYNLVSNAIKYSQEGNEILTSVKLDGNTFELKVTDYGIGIPKSEHHLMFDRFFRAQNVTNIQGTGLGLNIVKKYVDLLEGDINFTSEENKGTTFTVTLPLRLEL